MKIQILPRMLTIKDAAEQTGLPDYYLRKICIQKEVKAIKSGKKYYINERSLSDYLNKESEVKTWKRNWIR